MSLRLLPRRLAAALLAVAAVAVCLAAPSPAAADPFGQLGAYLDKGGSAEALNANLTGIGFDPQGRRLFTIDPVSEGEVNSRLREFALTSTSGASLKGTVNLDPESSGTAQNPIVTTYSGVAVDPAYGRAYVLRLRSTGTSAGKVIGVTPYAESNLAAGAQIAVPTGEATITDAFGFAVDPATHDLIIAGTGTAGGKSHVVLQRIHVAADGTSSIGSRLVDTNDLIGSSPSGGPTVDPPPFSLAVADDGTAYIASGQPSGISGAVYRVPSTFDSFTWINPLHPLLVPQGLIGSTNTPAFLPAPQIAVTPDGKTLYYASGIAELAEGQGGGGAVRAISTTDGSIQAVYGGGATTCHPAPQGVYGGLAAGENGSVYVADPGFGVTQFGPGGTGCPTARADFTFRTGQGDVESVTVTKGSELTLVSSTEIDEPSAFRFDLDQSGAFATAFKATSPFEPGVFTVRALRAGEYPISMKAEVLGSASGNQPAVVQRTIIVKPGTPVASFVASNTNPAPDETVTFDASGSLDPTGSPEAGPTHDLAGYTWDFGDGSAPVTTTAKTVTHAFANAATTASPRTVRLTVKGVDGPTATTTRVISVKGVPVPVPPALPTPAPTQAPQSSPSPSPSPSPAPTKPAPKPTPKQKALAKCKKLKGKAKKKCVAKANAIGKTKHKPGTRH